MYDIKLYNSLKEKTMKSIKKMLLGTAIIIFGLTCMYIANLSSWYLFELAGLLLPFAGMVIVILGYLEEN